MKSSKYEDITYKKTNRQESQTPKGGAGWCSKCDRHYLTGYAKCPVCGNRNRDFRLKKEPI